MQITLVQAEIEQALRDFINEHINIRDGKEIRIDLRATRGAEGFQAIIDIEAPGKKEEPEQTTQKEVPVLAPVPSPTPTPASTAATTEPAKTEPEEESDSGQKRSIFSNLKKVTNV